jgi:hypothetical protein
MRLNWADALRDLDDWTRLAPPLLNDGPSTVALPPELRPLASSRTRNLAAALVENTQCQQWVRVLYQATDADGWQAVGQFVTAPAPAHYWSAPTGEPAWVHATGTLAIGADPTNVTAHDLLILYRPEVTALIVGEERLAVDGSGLALIVRPTADRPPLAALVAGDLVPLWYPPGE